MSYADFDIEIGRGEGRRFPVAVRGAAGEARHEMTFPYDELALELALERLQNALLRSGGRRRKALSPQETAVRDFGRALFDALLDGEARALYRQSRDAAERDGRGLRLRLRILDPALAALPWEFLWDPRDEEYIALSRETPVIRFLELARPIVPLRIAAPLRILGMVCSPDDLEPLDIEREKMRVEQAVVGLRARGLVELHWLEGQQWRDVQAALRRGPWHIFHFVGHGGYDANGDEGLIYFSNEEGKSRPFHATQLGRLLADHRPLRLALLNACEGARGSQHDLFSSAAATLVQRGLPAVLAMQYAITDRAAVELARSFYEALADGEPVDAALAEARKAISFAVANSVEWGTPVLFMRSTDGVLFKLTDTPPRPPVEPKSEPAPPSEPAMSPQQRALLATLRDPEHPPKERVAAGVKLAAVGDPRPEVMTVEGMELCLVPAGPFTMGSVTEAGKAGRDPKAWDEEGPQQVYDIPYDYWIGRFPVTNAQYAEFMADGGYSRAEFWGEAEAAGVWAAGKIVRYRVWVGSQWEERTESRDRPESFGVPFDLPNHPVVGVTWYEALAFTRWLDERLNRGMRRAPAGRWRVRLPNEPEWEKAARGGHEGPTAPIIESLAALAGDAAAQMHGAGKQRNPAPARRYPWEGNLDPNRASYDETAIGATSAVGAFPGGASVYGAEEMVGTVWEWTRSVWGDYPYPSAGGALSAREDLSLPDVTRVLRGGSFADDGGAARCAFRLDNLPQFRFRNVGFRVAVSPPLVSGPSGL